LAFRDYKFTDIHKFYVSLQDYGLAN
jgi:hypothetical protein